MVGLLAVRARMLPQETKKIVKDSERTFESLNAKLDWYKINNVIKVDMRTVLIVVFLQTRVLNIRVYGG